MSDPSYRRINFGVRYAKNIERKMLAESFRRLTPFSLPESYRYVGFGSIYFTDFILFHKYLGICNMISIEGDDAEEKRPRFRLNKPYHCVEIKFGTSNEVLPTLAWDKLTILWLDYDKHLNASHLNDIATFIAQATPGSLLITTVNADFSRFEPKELLEKLKSNVGEDHVPRDVENSDLTGFGLAKVCRRIITNVIDSEKRIRNGALTPAAQLDFRQLYNFHYNDGARMLTHGGILISADQEPTYGVCRFDELPFVRTGEDPFNLKPPHLTFRELRYLDAQLPYDRIEDVDLSGIPVSDVEDYAGIYRFYPAFADSEI